MTDNPGTEPIVDADEPIVDAVEIALIGTEVLERDFGFDQEQLAAWMDAFLTMYEARK